MSNNNFLRKLEIYIHTHDCSFDIHFIYKALDIYVQNDLYRLQQVTTLKAWRLSTQNSFSNENLWEDIMRFFLIKQRTRDFDSLMKATD